MAKSIWEAWVPITMDPDHPHSEDFLIRCWGNQQDQIQELIRENRLLGEFNPNFELGDGSHIKNLYRYLTVSATDAVFSVQEFDYSDKANLYIQIKVLPNSQNKLKKAYHAGNDKPLIFVPRMLHRTRFVTFDAYPADTYPNWMHM
ncbi:MAG: hypothetical protein NC548_06040 [Lachnospiraceae bacterium]|nr:hypothetical protein [Lachnospiraceae bacterium]